MKQFLAILFFGFFLAQGHANADCVTYCDATATNGSCIHQAVQCGSGECAAYCSAYATDGSCLREAAQCSSSDDDDHKKGCASFCDAYGSDGSCIHNSVKCEN